MRQDTGGLLHPVRRSRRRGRGRQGFFLPFDTDFVEKDVAAVTEQLVVVHDGSSECCIADGRAKRSGFLGIVTTGQPPARSKTGNAVPTFAPCCIYPYASCQRSSETSNRFSDVPFCSIRIRCFRRHRRIRTGRVRRRFRIRGGCGSSSWTGRLLSSCRKWI